MKSILIWAPDFTKKEYEGFKVEEPRDMDGTRSKKRGFMTEATLQWISNDAFNYCIGAVLVLSTFSCRTYFFV